MLTKKQQEVLDFLKDYYQKHEITPTLKEVADHFRVRVPTVQGYFKELEYKGYIKKLPNKSRAIQFKDEIPKNLTVSLPMLGKVCAGDGVDWHEENNPETVEVPSGWLNPSQKNYYFCLKVEGFSMIKDNVLDGDVIIVKKQNWAENGDSVIAIIKDQEKVTLKKFYQDEDTIELRPKSNIHKPITTNSKNVDIKGKFVGLLRSA